MRLPWTKVQRSEKGAPQSSDAIADTATDTGTEVPDTRKSAHEMSGAAEQPPIGTIDQAFDSKKDAEDAPTTAHATSQASESEKRTQLERINSTATTSSAGDEDTSKYKTGLPLYLLTFGLAMSTFVVALDNTIIATAIPRITTVFNSLNDVGWYGSSYLLTTTSLQPTFGKIYQYFNVKYTYLFALFIFEVGSILCGAAVNSPMLIVGRAVAGVGASALFSGGMTIVAYTVPLHRRPIYIGLLSSMFGISSVIGPLLGGAFTDRVSWRWCFYINLPVGAIAMTAVFFFFQNPERKETEMSFKQKIKQMDLFGAAFLISAIVCLLLALQWGGSVYPWKSSQVWGCLLGFGLLIIIFIGIQIHRGDLATLPPRIIAKQRTVRSSALFSVFLAMALYTHIYYLPFYFQAVKGTTAEGSGIRTIPYLVSITIASIVVGAFVTIVGLYVPFTWVGSVVFCVGSGVIYTLKVGSSAGVWIGYQILAGVGAGMCVQIPFIAVQVVLSKKDMPIGNATAIFFNSLGGAISISIAQNIFSNTLIKELPKHAPGLDPQIIIAAGATHIRQVVPANLLPGVLLAYNNALTEAYILAIACSGLAFLASLMFEWKSVKGHKLELGGGA